MAKYDAKITGQKAVAGGVIGAIAAFLTAKVSAIVEPFAGDDPTVTGAIYSASIAVLTAGYNAVKFFLTKKWGKEDEPDE
jgi:hypothetical protein